MLCSTGSEDGGYELTGRHDANDGEFIQRRVSHLHDHVHPTVYGYAGSSWFNNQSGEQSDGGLFPDDRVTPSESLEDKRVRQRYYDLV